MIPLKTTSSDLRLDLNLPQLIALRGEQKGGVGKSMVRALVAASMSRPSDDPPRLDGSRGIGRPQRKRRRS